MSLQSSLCHIVGLILVLLATSFFPLSLGSIGEALAEVRVPLVMALGVAILYLGLLQRQNEQVKQVAQQVDTSLERQRQIGE